MPKTQENNKTYAILFPELLHDLLEDADNNSESDIVSWSPNGRCFRVYKKEDFVKTILPRYFKLSHYRSFTRQLNIWGFHCIETGPEKGYYQNEHFVRGRRELCRGMFRETIKGTGKKRRPSQQSNNDPPARFSTTTAAEFPPGSTTLGTSIGFAGVPAMIQISHNEVSSLPLVLGMDDYHVAAGRRRSSSSSIDRSVATAFNAYHQQSAAAAVSALLSSSSPLMVASCFQQQQQQQRQQQQQAPKQQELEGNTIEDNHHHQEDQANAQRTKAKQQHGLSLAGLLVPPGSAEQNIGSHPYYYGTFPAATNFSITDAGARRNATGTSTSTAAHQQAENRRGSWWGDLYTDRGSVNTLGAQFLLVGGDNTQPSDNIMGGDDRTQQLLFKNGETTSSSSNNVHGADAAPAAEQEEEDWLSVFEKKFDAVHEEHPLETKDTAAAAAPNRLTIFELSSSAAAAAAASPIAHDPPSGSHHDDKISHSI